MNDLQGLVKQCQRDTHRWFPDVAEDLAHLALGLNGEAGEVADIVKKIERGSYTLDQKREHLGEELVDTLIYLCCMAAEAKVDLVDIYKQKRAKNELRFGKGPLTDLLRGA
jgi:NTP pyrophosphatase (non-canonical NTP hydrolase)